MFGVDNTNGMHIANHRASGNQGLEQEMRKMTEKEITSARIAGKAAVEADRRGDTVAREAAMRDLFVSAGYWLQSRQPTVSEYRGDAVPPKMVRMPVGRSVPWATKRSQAAEAWANAKPPEPQPGRKPGAEPHAGGSPCRPRGGRAYPGSSSSRGAYQHTLLAAVGGSGG